jgi:signal transduction histidine kinase
MSIGGRLTAATTALVATIAGLGLLALYVFIDYRIERDADGAVAREVAAIQNHLRGLGSDAREAEILRRSRNAGAGHSIILYESHQQIVAGNLPAWPKELEAGSPDVDFSWEERIDGILIVRHARATALHVGKNQNLLVGQDLTRERNMQEVVGVAAVGIFGLVVLLAVTGGVAIGRSLLQRVEGMNRTVLEILGGRREERVPMGDRADEFDELARHFNRLLDDNQKLLAQMRGITDDIAHDLRTPLARMHARIESALGATASEAELRETLHALSNEANDVLETFNALLRIAQIESGVVREQMEPVALAAIVSDAVELYQPLAEESGLELRGDAPAELHALARSR